MISESKLKEGSLLNDRKYEVIEHLGRGGFSDVYSVFDKDKQQR